jgi:hypothetical protein
MDDTKELTSERLAVELSSGSCPVIDIGEELLARAREVAESITERCSQVSRAASADPAT